MKHLTVLLIVAVLVLGMSACGRSEQKEDTANVQNTEGEAENVTVSASPEENEVSMMEISKSFVLPPTLLGCITRMAMWASRCGILMANTLRQKKPVRLARTAVRCGYTGAAGMILPCRKCNSGSNFSCVDASQRGLYCTISGDAEGKTGQREP